MDPMGHSGGPAASVMGYSPYDDQVMMSGVGYPGAMGSRSSPRNSPQYDFLMAKYNNVSLL